jgi:hypothetical protein
MDPDSITLTDLEADPHPIPRRAARVLIADGGGSAADGGTLGFRI